MVRDQPAWRRLAGPWLRLDEKAISSRQKQGDAAKPLLPELRQREMDPKAHREARTKVLKPGIDRIRKLIETLGAS